MRSILGADNSYLYASSAELVLSKIRVTKNVDSRAKANAFGTYKRVFCNNNGEAGLYGNGTIGRIVEAQQVTAMRLEDNNVLADDIQ